jgi:RNA recognition motif-containing protein
MGKGTQDADIERLLQKHHVNDYDSFTVLYEKSTGKCRGSATITYSTTQRAERAVRMLDGSSFQNRLLKVKIARESRTISTAAYPVVNGSTY